MSSPLDQHDTQRLEAARRELDEHIRSRRTRGQKVRRAISTSSGLLSMMFGGYLFVSNFPPTPGTAMARLVIGAVLLTVGLMVLISDLTDA